VHKVEQIARDHKAPRFVLVGVVGVMLQEGGKLLVLERDTLLDGCAVFLGDLFAEVEIAEDEQVMRRRALVRHRLLLGQMGFPCVDALSARTVCVLFLLNLALDKGVTGDQIRGHFF
jgi:hypothetical protein